MRSQNDSIETIEGAGIPKRKRRQIVMLVIVIMFGVYTGFAIGNFFISQRSDPNRYNYDVKALSDDVDAIRLMATGKNPQTLGAIKSGVLAFDTTFKEERVFVTGDGLVNARVGPVSVAQTIDAKTIRMGDKMFNENVSISSYVKATNRFYVNGEEISHYSGNYNESTKTVTWKTTPDTPEDIKTMTLYTEKYGVPMNYYMSFIVSSKTVIEASAVTVNEDGNYVFTLTLDRIKSVINYVKSMKDTGGLSDYPDFVENPVIELVIDKNYRILKFTSKEVYKAKMGVITANLSGSLTNTFRYDEDFVIPELSENSVIN